MEFFKMDEWGCFVEKVHNGYIVVTRERLNDDSYTYRKSVFSEDDSCNSESKAFLDVLHHMMEVFGLYDVVIKMEDKDGKEIIPNNFRE